MDSAAAAASATAPPAADHSVLPQLWIPVAVFAHVYAAVWLIRAFQLFQPAAWARLTAAFGSKSRHHQPTGRASQNSNGSSQTSLTTCSRSGGSASRQHLYRGAGINSQAVAPEAVAGYSSSQYPQISYQTPAGSGSRSLSTSETGTSGDCDHHAVAIVSEASVHKAANSAAAGKGTPGSGPGLSQQQQQPLTLSWRGISCTYKTAAGDKSVLQDVWGEAAAGEMQALIGPSGAGKSSLLDILACRKATGSISGTTLLDGRQVQRGSYTRRVAYVPQDDNFVPVMTCLEVLNFHAAMQLPDHQQQAGQQPDNSSTAAMDEEQAGEGLTEWQHQGRLRASSRRHQVVQEVLDVVGLSQHAGTLVGGRLSGGLLLRGLSSGERRRLSIAVGILASPDILFLDEPTSGLDSFAALSVMSHLQGLAQGAGKAVIAAIHQPRSAIWSLFDKVTLLASGLLIFHGPASGLVAWLSGLGFAYDPLAHGLASDWALDLVVVEFNKTQAFQSRTMTTLAELQAAADKFKQHYMHGRPQQLQLQQQQQQSTTQQQVQRRQQQGWSYLAPNADAGGVCGPHVVSVFEAAFGALQHLPTGPLSRGGSTELYHSSSSSNHSSNSSGQPLEQHQQQQQQVDKDGPDTCIRSSAQHLQAQQQQDQQQQGTISTLIEAARMLKALYVAPDGVRLSSTGTSSRSQPQQQQQQEVQDIVQQQPTVLHKAQQQQQHVQALPTAAPAPAAATTAVVTSSSSSSSSSSSPYPTSWLQQYKALAWREVLKVTRNPADVAGRTLTFTWVALMVGLIYYDMPSDAGSIRQRLNLLFATLCFFLLMPFINMSMYTDDKGVYLADKAAKLYRPSAYYVAKASIMLPFNILSALCYCLTQYGMTGMRPDGSSIFKHSAIGTITSLIAVQVLHLAATVSPNADAAFMMGIGWTCVQLVMSGFFIPYKEIGFSVLANLRYLSALHYAFEGLLQVELGGRLFSCPAGGIDSQSAAFFTQLLPGAAALATPERLQALLAGGGQGSGGDCVVDSSAVSAYFGFSRGFGTTIGILVGYLGVMHVVTFLAMLLVARKERR